MLSTAIAPAYKAANKLMQEIDTDTKTMDIPTVDDNHAEEKQEAAIDTNHLPNTKKNKAALHQKIDKLDKKLSKVNSAINKMEIRHTCASIYACFSCSSGALLTLSATASMVSAVDDLRRGDVRHGSSEIKNGLAMLSVGSHELNEAARTIDRLAQETTLSELAATKNEIRNERTQLLKELYEVEKEETLEIFHQRGDNHSPLYLAIKNQFNAIDLAAKNKFSKTYIDVAINTKRMVTANTEKERLQRADRHVALCTKQSIPKIVAGSMLIVAGIALAIASLALAAALIKFIPPLAPVIVGLGFGASIFTIKKGVDFIESGKARARPPLLVQSLFKVAETVKDKPTITNNFSHVDGSYVR